jgi:hypothetical protein
MKFEQFRKKYQSWPVIPSAVVVREDQAEYQVNRNQLSRWAKKGDIVPLRKGMYAFPPEEATSAPEILTIANRLYEPSYISMEYALSLYELIPEYVPTVTSVTTRKTMSFENALGKFSYQHVVPRAFRGFRQEKQAHDRQVFVAEPEKAVLDFLYLNMSKFREDFEGVLIGSFRFQNLETLNPKRIADLSECYENKNLSRMTDKLKSLIRKEKT